ncbi:DUF3152 domain-containing protein [Georgenia sp. 311]|uniref:DUF3152 domain-containing protein n=1 Tax=Georgenia wutianyii TaxID=2585135 RepID=A0ABX5VIE4_9MICO|nr:MULTISPECIES: DUF3152 domain-containing protein [Georgenia]QDB78091.1 DUF3152 domain-containing protein [Georgenia wutianyii]TNC17535.1 DUF3152 domain-containing protein [Georgenia sp. 311]
MTRGSRLVPVLAWLLAVGATTGFIAPPDDGAHKVVAGRQAAVEVPPSKSPTLGFVPEQGGLWRLEIPHDAGGDVRTVRGRSDPPREAGRTVSVRVLVEVGLGIDGQEFARQVMATLNDERGWGHDGSIVFARTDGEADVDVTLASPATTDALCAPVATGGRVSCGRVGFAVLNAERWAHGAEPFLEAGGTVAEYRRYLVSHEVGHVLGQAHVRCPVPGAPAPVMLQQTLGLDGCLPNGWPALGG